MLPTRTVTIYTRSAFQLFRFFPELSGGAGELLLKKDYSVTTGADGTGTIDLPCSTSGIFWTCITPSMHEISDFQFVLTPGAALSLDELFVAGNIAPPGSPIYAYVAQKIAEISLSPSGNSAVVEKMAGETLSGHRFVFASNSFEVKLLDNSDISNKNLGFGITTGAANSGDAVDVKIFGEIDEPTWNWAAGGLIFCGAGGILTQTPPPDGFLLIVGAAISTDKIFINIGKPINLI